MDWTVIVALASGIAGVVTFLIGFLVSYAQRSARRQEERRLDRLSDASRREFANTLRKYYDADRADYIYREIRNYLVHYSSAQSLRALEAQANRKLEELKQRIEKIESRFPQDATLEKIANVNDAILGTRLDALSESLKGIQDSMLTRWDVAKVVFTILGAVGVLVAIVFAVLNWIKPG